LARELTQAATISERVFASGTGTSMVSGTLTNTPTSGDVLIAVIARRADGQATTTNPTGWTNLTKGATAGSRSLEVWWFRSTGVVGDKGAFTWTTASGTGAWGIELIRIGGSGAYADPTLKTAATAFTATTTPAAVTEAPVALAEAPGMSLTCIAVTGASLGASGITAAFSGTGTAESTTSYYDSTYGGMGVSVNKLYNNVAYGAPTYGTAYTLNASRAGHQAVIHLDGGGSSTPQLAGLGAGVNYNAGATNYPGGLMQSYATWDTSSIPDNNTISSVTLGLRALATSVASLYTTTDPANATLQARYYGTSITDTRGNNNSHWAMSPTQIAAKTLVATYPAASAWTAGTDYTLTSTGSFASSINKTGNTVLCFTTDDYATATARSSRETYGFDISGTFAPLTVVHSFAGTATVTASLTVTPTISRTVAYAKSIAASLTTTPVIARTVAYARTITSSVTSTPAISTGLAYLRTITASLTVTPTITRAVALAKTIAATLTATPTIVATKIPYVAQVARVIRLGGRTTIQLVQTVTARLGGRTTIRAPKE